MFLIWGHWQILQNLKHTYDLWQMQVDIVDLISEKKGLKLELLPQERTELGYYILSIGCY